MRGGEQGVRPRHVLCVLGTGLELGLVDEVVAQAGCTVDREYSQQAPDPRMTAAFRACLSNDTFTGADWAAVAGHDSVAYVLSPPMPRAASLDTSRRMLAVTAALLRSGATAVKSDSSGLTHGRDRWLELAEQAATAPDPGAVAGTLYHAWVKRPVAAGTVLYSCGMHLLAAPDVEVKAGRRRADPVRGWVDLIDGLAIYLLTEPRAWEMHDGEAFRLGPDTPRWLLERRRCRRYGDDDFFFNPYGYWRLNP
ncbi:MAG TPA: hypothetical protein VJT31_41235 [Rugosimonospora sp.]|nr:hypothetical protein [Rugosimonospora sp.]